MIAYIYTESNDGLKLKIVKVGGNRTETAVSSLGNLCLFLEKLFAGI